MRTSLLAIHKIVRMFVNTLTLNDKHYLLNKDNLTQRIQMQLSKKQKTFCQFFFRIFKIYIIFKHLQKKDDLHS